MNNDFLHQVIAAASAATLESPGAVAALEVALRQQWGGGRVYIQKAPSDRVAAVLAVELAAGATPGQAIAAAGCSSSTGYRLLSRRWSP
jgi:hypothetical protein